jgi:NAD(P)-dependent dehydrogenase (short-subunit alcohol dehydrogenase family)
MGRVEGKVCVVTGGAKGLGLEFASALVAEGAKVLAVDIAECDQTRLSGASYQKADISDAEAAEMVAATCLSNWGRIDVLVNNAAVYSTLATEKYDEIDPDLFDRVLSTNVGGTWRMVRAVGPIMERQKSGKIVNVTSGTVYKGLPGMAHYIASKGAVAALTRALSRELGSSGVCVNSLAPGLTLSSSIMENRDHLDAMREKVIASRALQRDGFPKDLIGALMFLCSSDSDFVTGQTIVVDGGSVNT